MKIPAWFSKMSPAQKKAYLAKHPTSIYGPNPPKYVPISERKSWKKKAKKAK